MLNHNRGQARLVIEAWNRHKCVAEMQFQTDYVLFLRKGDYSFRRFTCNRELIVGAAAEKRLPILGLVLGTPKVVWKQMI